MPRITLFRTASLLLTFIIGLIGLWFALPSPTTIIHQSTYDTVLWSGRRLTTIHSPGWRFRSPGLLSQQVDKGQQHHGVYSSVILSWQLEQSHPTDNITLRIGQPQKTAYRNMGCDIDLTRMRDSSPRFAEEGCYLSTPAGDQDGLSLPYFDIADATLLYYALFQTWQEVYLRVLIPEPGVLQVWKYIPDWNGYSVSDIASIDEDDRRNYLVATFMLPHETLQQDANPVLDSVHVTFQDARLASRTYPVRRLILAVLAPLYLSTTWIAFTVVYPILIATVVGLYYMFVVTLAFTLVIILCWFVYGRPRAFAAWSKDFFLTRYIARRLFGAPRPRIWSALGPLDELHLDEDQHEVRPVPLTNPFGFFQSSSPLDDLLVTFTATRWMVQPLRRNTANERPTKYTAWADAKFNIETTVKP